VDYRDPNKSFKNPVSDDAESWVLMCWIQHWEVYNPKRKQLVDLLLRKVAVDFGCTAICRIKKKKKNQSLDPPQTTGLRIHRDGCRESQQSKSSGEALDTPDQVSLLGDLKQCHSPQ
jgi:hypothetical protein